MSQNLAFNVLVFAVQTDGNKGARALMMRGLVMMMCFTDVGWYAHRGIHGRRRSRPRHPGRNGIRRSSLRFARDRPDQQQHLGICGGNRRVPGKQDPANTNHTGRNGARHLFYSLLDESVGTVLSLFLLLSCFWPPSAIDR